MAKTVERKLEVARRIYEIVVGEYGLPPGALIFDALTFTLATGEAEFLDSAVETIEGIRAIKRELPGVLDVAWRLQRFVRFEAGGARRAQLRLSAPLRRSRTRLALVHPKDITPYFEIDAEMRELCDDLVFNRRPDALLALDRTLRKQRARELVERRGIDDDRGRAGRAADSSMRFCAAAKTASKPRSTRRCSGARRSRCSTRFCCPR